jgi:methionyl-tRNA formyltransferase
VKIVFMGTPEFAVACLDALHQSTHTVVAVVTAPDKPTGRGLQMNMSAVKKYALEHDLPVLQPEKLKNPVFLEELKSFGADMQVVVAFRMLPELVWAMPARGTINLHASLLPNYRGAAPINWAIINGETESGVSTFFIEKEIDTGNIIFTEKLSIGLHENAGELHDRMMHAGAQLIVKTVDAVQANDYPNIPQDFSKTLNAAPKIFKETCQIDFNKTAKEIHDFIRGLSPYPSAWTSLLGKQLKIFKAEPFLDISQFENLKEILDQDKAYFTDHKNVLIIKTQDAFLNILQLQLEGKKRMETAEFLRGYKF